MPDPDAGTVREFWAAMSEAQHLEYACENLKALVEAAESGQLWSGTAKDAQGLFESYEGKRNLGRNFKAICKSLGLGKNTELLDGISIQRNWIAHDFIREWEGSRSRDIEIDRLRRARLELAEARQKVDSISQSLLRWVDQHLAEGRGDFNKSDPSHR
ncbi:hypothetical protein [Amaricoccus sp.]|uniref:hypothetical protein n=1 Tax=Amaricoccus sp. TaxID=1872485 RepID=UPI00260FDC92|nr:hypothetical protein [Amaricoccus sp.]HRO11309.1 hypothetical protein [Amaricoccus sp.]